MAAATDALEKSTSRLERSGSERSSVNSARPAATERKAMLHDDEHDETIGIAKFTTFSHSGWLLAQLLRLLHRHHLVIILLVHLLLPLKLHPTITTPRFVGKRFNTPNCEARAVGVLGQ